MVNDERSLRIFPIALSNTPVVLLAKFRTSAYLISFHVFALRHVFAQIFYFCTGGDAFSQEIERSFIFSF